METVMEALVQKAKQGRPEALEDIIIAIQDKVYNLALRMLGHPEDAEDGAQEILIKVTTNIGGFREESSFMTWVYRIAANYLLTTRKRRAEQLQLSFELLESAISPGEGPRKTNSDMNPEEWLLVEEMKHTCIQGTLLCLGREVRLALILGEVFKVSSDEGAYILDITPAAFRKRLSRGRELIRDFMLKNCGVVKPENPCNCLRQVILDAKRGWINPERFVYADKRGTRDSKGNRSFEELDELERITALFRDYPRHPTPAAFADTIKSLIQRS